MIEVRHLIKSKEQDVIRFAKWLGLYIPNTMGHKQLARLIKWRISLNRDDMLNYFLESCNAYKR